MRNSWGLVLVGLTMVWSLGCGGGETEQVEDESFDFGDFTLVNDEGKEDGLGVAALPVSADGTETAVWTVKNQWADINTAAAKKAGLAWGENSGLNWEQKYQKWVESLPRIEAYDGYDTFLITNPQGKSLPAPALECSEVAIFLRITFASWYNLPFFMEARDSAGRVYLGHFGWRNAAGRYKNSPKYKSWYRDYTGGNYTEENWPRDTTLAARGLYGADDDYQPFIDENARVGKYMDEMFLNKRVGYLMLLAFDYFGSMNLADSSNTFNLKAAAVQEGDFLVERWQSNGIGHTLIVKSVDNGKDPGTLAAELASGSMPRRQPKWEDAVASKYYFTTDATGGEGTNWDGEEYAKLGGGLKRWRVAQVSNGYYVNTIMQADRANWISNTEYAKIAARPGEFETLLSEPDPAEKLQGLLNMIEGARTHLRAHPASCSARTNRENAFRALYEMAYQLNMDTEEVDRTYRKFEDYVFAELEYTVSKTCCWNSTTAAMFEIVMDYNEQYVAQGNACKAPVVFMNNNGYSVFKNYAVATGRGDQWVDWSEDEPCAQRSVASDTETEHEWTAYCEGDPAVGPDLTH